MRCDGCKHWKKGSDNAEWEAESAGFGECLGVRERWVIQDEASEGMKWDSEDNSSFVTKRVEALKAARAYVQDGSQYRAELFTAPDFFCALHAAL
jgi:hypothetical protein